MIGASSLGPGTGCTFYFEVPCKITLPEQNNNTVTVAVTTHSNNTSSKVESTVTTTHISLENKLEEGLGSTLMPLSTEAPRFSQRLPPTFTAPAPVTIDSPELHLRHSFTTTASSAPKHYLPPLVARGSPKTTVHSRSKYRGGLLGSSRASNSSSEERSSIRSAFSVHSVQSSGGGSSGTPHSATSLSIHSRSIATDSERTAAKQKVLHQSLAGLKILLVDDSALARKMVERSLFTLQGCTVHHAQNGQECIDKVKQSQNTAGETPYDVIVSDCYMPVLNGPEAIKILRGHEVQFKVRIDTVFCMLNEP